MYKVAIVANGPTELLPDISIYKDDISSWIGADGGALSIIDNQIKLDYALGDFDSITAQEKIKIKKHADFFAEYPSEKDQTDLEIALDKAYELKPDKIYLFGVTGRRLDHELVNIQTLHSIMGKNIQGIIVDAYNQIEMKMPGKHTITKNKQYPNISFLAFSSDIKGLTLDGFYYPLTDQTISWGSTLCISNKLTQNNGTFSYEAGILLLIKSRDAISDTTPK